MWARAGVLVRDGGKWWAGLRRCSTASGRGRNVVQALPLWEKDTGRGEYVSRLAKAWREANYVPTCEELEPLLRQWARTGQVKQIEELMKQLDRSGVLFTTALYLSLIQAQFQRGEVVKGLYYFHEMCYTGIVPSLDVYLFLFKALRKSKNFEEAHWLWKDMEGKSIKPTAETYAWYGALLLMDRGYGGVMRFYDSEKSKESFDNQTVLNEFATVLNQLGDASVAQVVVNEMVSLGCKPSTQTLSSFVYSLTQLGHLSEARGILDDIEMESVSTTAEAYNALLRGYFLVGDLEKASQLLERMEGPGSVAPTTETYAICIDAYQKLGELSSVMSTFAVLKEKGQQVTEGILADVVRAQIFAGNLRDAAGIFLREGLPTNLSVGRDTECLLLERLLASDEHVLAIEVFEAFENLGAQLFPPAISALIVEAYAITNQRQNALRRWVNLNRTHRKLEDTASLNAFLKTQKTIDPRQVYNLFRHFMADGTSPNETTFSILVETFGLLKRQDKVEDMVEMMKDRGLSPNKDFLEALATAYIEIGNISKGIQVLEAAVRRGLKPELKNHKGIILYFARTEIANMYKMIEQLCSDNVRLTSDLFEYAINTLFNAREFGAAHNVYELMRKSEVTPHRELVDVMISTSGKRGDLSDVLYYFTDMISLRMEPSQSSLNWVFRSLARENQLDLLEQLYKATLAYNTETDSESRREILIGFAESEDFVRGVLEFSERIQAPVEAQTKFADVGKATETLPETVGDEDKAIANVPRRMLTIAKVLSNFPQQDTALGLCSPRSSSSMANSESDLMKRLHLAKMLSEEKIILRERPALKRTGEDNGIS